MRMEFDGRNVLLTGVGRAGQVGEAVAQAFAQRGARLLLVAHHVEQARERADALVAKGQRATPFAADLTDMRAVASLADAVRTATDGQLHAVVHIAGGFSMSGPVAESDPAEWTRLFAMNGTTAYLVARAFVPLLRATKGSLTCFASEAALPGASAKNRAAYVAAKSAVVALVHAVAEEERANGVRANAVAPSTIRTADNVAAMGEKPMMVSREAVADVVCWLASNDARAVSGQVVAVR
jgi:NAD(P)-dependent dehydrogenase (short-subunit alcohol dehydrogenase family)